MPNLAWPTLGTLLYNNRNLTTSSKSRTPGGREDPKFPERKNKSHKKNLRIGMAQSSQKQLWRPGDNGNCLQNPKGKRIASSKFYISKTIALEAALSKDTFRYSKFKNLASYAGCASLPPPAPISTLHPSPCLVP